METVDITGEEFARRPGHYATLAQVGGKRIRVSRHGEFFALLLGVTVPQPLIDAILLEVRAVVNDQDREDMDFDALGVDIAKQISGDEIL